MKLIESLKNEMKVKEEECIALVNSFESDSFSNSHFLEFLTHLSPISHFNICEEHQETVR